MSLDQAAERALIGALLLEPSRYDEVRDWLEPNDFHSTAPHQAYTGIVALHGRGEEATAQAVDTEIRRTVRQGTQLADGPWLITTMQSTPHGNRAAIYGRMVLDLSIRRHIGEDAIQLRQVGETALSTEQMNRVFATIDGISQGVAAMHRRESDANELHSVTPLNTGGLTQLVRFPRYEHLAPERDLIFSVLEQPESLQTIGRWLRTSDFSDNECGLLYGELTALHDARNPIDRLTLAWRAAKVGIEGPACELLLSPKPGPMSLQDPIDAARTVLEQSVQAAVLATSDELERLSADPSLNATSVAYARLNALWPQQRRLIKSRVWFAGAAPPP